MILWKYVIRLSFVIGFLFLSTQITFAEKNPVADEIEFLQNDIHTSRVLSENGWPENPSNPELGQHPRYKFIYYDYYDIQKLTYNDYEQSFWYLDCGRFENKEALYKFMGELSPDLKGRGLDDFVTYAKIRFNEVFSIDDAISVIDKKIKHAKETSFRIMKSQAQQDRFLSDPEFGLLQPPPVLENPDGINLKDSEKTISLLYDVVREYSIDAMATMHRRLRNKHYNTLSCIVAKLDPLLETSSRPLVKKERGENDDFHQIFEHALASIRDLLDTQSETINKWLAYTLAACDFVDINNTASAKTQVEEFRAAAKKRAAEKHVGAAATAQAYDQTQWKVYNKYLAKIKKDPSPKTRDGLLNKYQEKTNKLNKLMQYKKPNYIKRFSKDALRYTNAKINVLVLATAKNYE